MGWTIEKEFRFEAAHSLPHLSPGHGHADAVAGLDDIGGDWRRSLRNYDAFDQLPHS